MADRAPMTPGGVARRSRPGPRARAGRAGRGPPRCRQTEPVGAPRTGAWPGRRVPRGRRRGRCARLVLAAVMLAASGSASRPGRATPAADGPEAIAEPGAAAAATKGGAANGAAPVLGDPAAPVLVEIWADYQCPYCGVMTHAMEGSILRDYVDTGRVRLGFRDFAFLGQESLDAAVAARCAGRQDAYWRYHDLVFASQQGENQGAFSTETLVAARRLRGPRSRDLRHLPGRSGHPGGRRRRHGGRAGPRHLLDPERQRRRPQGDDDPQGRARLRRPRRRDRGGHDRGEAEPEPRRERRPVGRRGLAEPGRVGCQPHAVARRSACADPRPGRDPRDRAGRGREPRGARGRLTRMKRLLALVAVGLVAAACSTTGGAGSSPTPDPTAGATRRAPDGPARHLAPDRPDRGRRPDRIRRRPRAGRVHPHVASVADDLRGRHGHHAGPRARDLPGPGAPEPADLPRLRGRAAGDPRRGRRCGPPRRGSPLRVRHDRGRPDGDVHRRGERRDARDDGLRPRHRRRSTRGDVRRGRGRPEGAHRLRDEAHRPGGLARPRGRRGGPAVRRRRGPRVHEPRGPGRARVPTSRRRSSTGPSRSRSRPPGSRSTASAARGRGASSSRGTTSRRCGPRSRPRTSSPSSGAPARRTRSPSAPSSPTSRAAPSADPPAARHRPHGLHATSTPRPGTGGSMSSQ